MRENKSETPNSEITAQARRDLSGNWVKSIFCTLFYFSLLAPAVSVGTLKTISQVQVVSVEFPFLVSVLVELLIFPLITLFATSFLSVGLAALSLSLSDKLPEFKVYFEGFSRIFRTMITTFMLGLFLFLWTLPFVFFGLLITPQKHSVPYIGVYIEELGVENLRLIPLLFIGCLCVFFFLLVVRKAYAYSMSFIILAADQDIGPIKAITHSRKIMDGNKFKFWRMQWRFFGWTLLCILTFGIGFIWLIPYMLTCIAEFYEDIR